MPVQPRSSSRPAAAAPPSTPNSDSETSASSSASVEAEQAGHRAHGSRSILRCTGTNRSGPEARPIRRWPERDQVRHGQLARPPGRRRR